MPNKPGCVEDVHLALSLSPTSSCLYLSLSLPSPYLHLLSPNAHSKDTGLTMVVTSCGWLCLTILAALKTSFFVPLSYIFLPSPLPLPLPPLSSPSLHLFSPNAHLKDTGLTVVVTS